MPNIAANIDYSSAVAIGLVTPQQIVDCPEFGLKIVFRATGACTIALQGDGNVVRTITLPVSGSLTGDMSETCYLIGSYAKWSWTVISLATGAKAYCTAAAISGNDFLPASAFKGLKMPNASQLSAIQNVSANSAVLGTLNGANAYVIGQDMFNAPASAFGCSYPQNDNAGATLADALNRGGPIAVGGVTAGAWATPGWFTHDAAGNTMKLNGIAGVDHMVSLKGECEIIVGMDIYYTTFPSSGNTETLWGIGRNDTTVGGVRFVAEGTTPDFALYYRPSGGGADVRLGVFFLTGIITFNAAVMNTLVAIRVMPDLNELRYRYFINGRVEFAGFTTLGAIPAYDYNAAMSFSGYGITPTNKLGTGGSTGCRTRNAFLFRHDGRDQMLAARLAKSVALNSALPSWLKAA